MSFWIKLAELWVRLSDPWNKLSELATNPISRGLILEAGATLLLLVVVAIFVFGWKPKLTPLRVLIAGSALVVSDLVLMFVTQERTPEIYIATIFFLGAPIIWLAIYSKNKDRNVAYFLVLMSALTMTALIEWEAVLRNYVTAFCVPVILIPCFQCWRNPKEEGFIRTSLKKWSWATGVLLGFLVLMVGSLVFDRENLVIDDYVKKYAFLLPVNAILFFFAKAVPEEVVFRGILQGLIKDKYGIFPAIVGSALLYGAAAINDPARWAFPNWHAAINALTLGLACGVVYYKTKSLAISGALNAAVSFLWWMLFARGGY
ncbi:MAG: CPBP family intramembrane metalloprotease [bacterium]|nr:CPBP family intramembrane metalloprotease [bacterium]